MIAGNTIVQGETILLTSELHTLFCGMGGEPNFPGIEMARLPSVEKTREGGFLWLKPLNKQMAPSPSHPTA